MTHDPIKGVPNGQHPLVKWLLQLRPPQPCYTGTWEVSSVLSSLGENSDLSLKLLSGKLALLMALVSASHSSELHSLDLRLGSTSQKVSF